MTKKTLCSLVLAAVLVVPTPVVAQAAKSGAASGAEAARSAAWQAAHDAIWPKELAIYSGRSKGDLSIYLANTADHYLAWPPHNEVPKGNEGLKATGAAMAGKTQERLEMTFLDLALNGDTAVIYYKTHRTRRADGTPADEHFEVTHTWVKQAGEWKVLGGMARSRPKRD
jgi:ketosteroid isomerase-like protein